ncbi:hypothetical protein [Cupriavidus sp. RAF12]|uniref:hypothetical protein n=1 Tax=Cupriavidus sp. RAF12 TaxID=3233050 RepID=UPI003F8F4CC8
MSTVEVLAPLRLETRFYAPDGQRPGWRLRLRVWPDEFSMARRPAPPSPEELDVFDDVLRQYADDADTRLRALAARLGMERAIWLRRTVEIDTSGVVPRADRSAEAVRSPDDYPDIHQPYGLPPALRVWFLEAGETVPTLAGTMYPDRGLILSDLELAAFAAPAADGELPQTWWTAFDKARAAGLAIEIPFPIGGPPPALEAIIVAGLGDLAPEPLAAMHAATGRLSVLVPGTPTNTVDGEATAEMGADPAAWTNVDSAMPVAQSASAAVMAALAGPDAAPVALQGGDAPAEGYGPTVVRALWPVLWGHALRDVTGAGDAEAQLAEWAAAYLSPEGPYPAIRVGPQPYGLLPATLLTDWSDPDLTASHVRDWVVPWRDAAAADACVYPGTVVGASAAEAVELLGQHAPTRRWGLRPLSTLPVVNAMQAMRGLAPSMPSPWDHETAASIGGRKTPLAPLAPFWQVADLPGSTPDGEADDPDTLRALLDTDSEAFPLRWQRKLGLLGHLIFETVCLLRASVGQAREAMDAGLPVDPTAPLPLQAGTDVLVKLVQRGYSGALANPHLNDLLSGDAGAQRVAKRYITGMEALIGLVEVYASDGHDVFACVLAALDTASHRVDPWITGLATERLRQLHAARAPWRLGAYGWVDSPTPYDAANPGQGLPPGPTAAGLLHAPSPTQAMTAALLRDAAIRYPGDTRWQIAIDSGKVRAAARLAERVRMGLHPYEALGLEVERIVGDWDAVRALRQQFPLRDTHAGQRCCDGARVLRQLFRPQPGDPPAPAFDADVRAALVVCDAALDTYADLLVADGIHALVSGQGGVGNAAMEAAAGLGAPPDLRAIRTPRQATSVRVSAWALLPPGHARGPSASPALQADPAFADLLDAELGPPQDWTWTIGANTVSLADRGLHGADALALGDADLTRLLRGNLDATLPVVAGSGADKLARASRLAELLGGGDSNPPVPGTTDGRDDEHAPATPLRDTMLADLSARLVALRTRLQGLLATFDGIDFNDPASGDWCLAQCRLWQATQAGDEEPLAQARARLQARAPVVPGPGVNGLRQAIRVLAGQPRLPVLPVVPSNLAPTMAVAAVNADDHPETDRTWLEIVAAVRPRLALLEARQLDATAIPWRAVVATPSGSADPWTRTGPVTVAYGPNPGALPDSMAVACLDAWNDAIPSDQHVTSAAFGFNGPKSRAPQAVLLAVPPDATQRLTDAQLAALVLETRLLARARANRPRPGARVATPAALSSFPAMFWSPWT